MQRQHPFLSPTGLALTAVFLIIIAALLFFTGGRMFSPGPLTALNRGGAALGGVDSHAGIDRCAACHQPLRSAQAALCLDCHQEIGTQLERVSGLHARLDQPTTCHNCHPDHRGTDFDPTAFARRDFDHKLAPFSLVHHQLGYDLAPLACESCHPGESFETDQAACLDCHAGSDPAFMRDHLAAFGPGCLDCHDGADRMADFDHSQTGFALDGAHETAGCLGCHQDSVFSELSAQCADCHAEPAIHAGLFPPTCGECHNSLAWSPATLEGLVFDHFEQTGFSLVRHELDFDGALLNCISCHTGSLLELDPGICVQCHTAPMPEFMAAHIAEFGPGCLDCHDGVDRMANFEHAAVFPLEGAHETLACAACHADQQFAGIPNQCSGCHAEPEIHAGLFGLNCQNCHTAAAWQPAALTSHNFPLDHGDEGEIPCQTCHLSSFTQYTCDECHVPAEMLEEHNKEDIFNIAGRCTECHPTGLKGESRD
jgi:hypothetical protein